MPSREHATVKDLAQSARCLTPLQALVLQSAMIAAGEEPDTYVVRLSFRRGRKKKTKTFRLACNAAAALAAELAGLDDKDAGMLTRASARRIPPWRDFIGAYVGMCLEDIGEVRRKAPLVFWPLAIFWSAAAIWLAARHGWTWLSAAFH